MKTSVVAFDLDDTLAETKTAIAPEMALALCQLLDILPVCVISGGRYEQFEEQLLSHLPPTAAFAQLHLMPTCGTRYLRHLEGKWIEIYGHDLPGKKKHEVMALLESVARELGLWEPDSVVSGSRIEDRGSQITFSALGQSASPRAKRAWDPDGTKRALMRSRLSFVLPTLEVREGGSTSIDITEKGVDKAYGIRQLCEFLKLSPAQVLFVGDRLDVGGNDYPVIGLGVETHAVKGPDDTLKLITSICREYKRSVD